MPILFKSLGQVSWKPCEHCRGHIFGPLFIKLSQNVHLHKQDVDTVSCGVKVGH